MNAKKPKIEPKISGTKNQYVFRNIPALINVAVIQGNSLPIPSNISLNTGNTNINITSTMITAKTITNIGYINVPITLPLMAASLLNNSNKRCNVFSNSPESSPALHKPI